MLFVLLGLHPRGFRVGFTHIGAAPACFRNGARHRNDRPLTPNWPIRRCRPGNDFAPAPRFQIEARQTGRQPTIRSAPQRRASRPEQKARQAPWSARAWKAPRLAQSFAEPSRPRLTGSGRISPQRLKWRGVDLFRYSLFRSGAFCKRQDRCGDRRGAFSLRMAHDGRRLVRKILRSKASTASVACRLYSDCK